MKRNLLKRMVLAALVAGSLAVWQPLSEAAVQVNPIPGLPADFIKGADVSMLPQTNSELVGTAVTDRKDEYTEKAIFTNLFSFNGLNFANFTFNTGSTPRIQRIRLKAKKFVYYKLIFRVDTEGATATVLGFDQKVRFGSMAK